jgi:hypothetical protein
MRTAGKRNCLLAYDCPVPEIGGISPGAQPTILHVAIDALCSLTGLDNMTLAVRRGEHEW